MLKNGENGRGIKSRWYPKTLKKRILEVNEMRERITFAKGDGLRVLRLYALPISFSRLIWSFLRTFHPAPNVYGPYPSSNVVFFIDPPYTVGDKQAGKRLYRHYEVDHEKLFRVVGKLRTDFLMTYSKDNTVHDLAQQHNFDVEEVTMRSSHHMKMVELLIGNDLDWVRRPRTST